MSAGRISPRRRLCAHGRCSTKARSYQLATALSDYLKTDATAYSANAAEQQRDPRFANPSPCRSHKLVRPFSAARVDGELGNVGVTIDGTGLAVVHGCRQGAALSVGRSVRTCVLDLCCLRALPSPIGC